MKLYWIKNIRLYNFLWERKIRPVIEDEEAAAFIPSRELLAAIESFNIRNYYFKNKQ